ncbi:H-type lectin domain-containing protein [Anianabacter salinae]|uniref:H-type lectin domain-containing protein n=1 Tax=Anianabacter salinae TaxID=2851023 RepID=UPI00225DFEB9|nr:H-type lectin domain-containing protein [Anianabacter salinae]MBV0914229.1 H-type lectin domain-containing protein [Anianabacter salinae]
MDILASHKKFQQTYVDVGTHRVLYAIDEMFNHVDEKGPMWSKNGDRSVVLYFEFSHHFGQPPLVSLGVCGLDSDKSANLRFSLRANDITVDGFVAEFLTWGDTRIARASIYWQALGLAA